MQGGGRRKTVRAEEAIDRRDGLGDGKRAPGEVAFLKALCSDRAGKGANAQRGQQAMPPDEGCGVSLWFHGLLVVSETKSMAVRSARRQGES